MRRLLSMLTPLGLFLLLNTPLSQVQAQSDVRIWEEDLVLPTYIVDPPEKSPMFFKNDSYQGASRVIYPYPLEDDFTNKKVDKTYRAVYLENDYLKVCVLPEIGGRLFYATDKTNGYEIFYRQHVIKPAHIGMLGAWISGGIEFCVFHHHRASTNMPIDYKLEEKEDGSATLWIGETELRHRMKWTFGITLYPGKSYLELDGRLINGTENTNSMLYWANVATSVNDDYQIIFPPSTDYAVFHAKNSFSHWPITQEAYRGNAYYENNIDASMWKNHPGQNSFFAHEIKEGFLAGYDHGEEAGTMVVGNPHIVKGAKLWEWGRGSYWDTHVLTDDDGPYAELMSGAYSDNQPDYSWLKPYEFKTFKQFWYPIRETKGASAANLNGLLHMEIESNERVFLAANTTDSYEGARLVLTRDDTVLFETQLTISPNKPFQTFAPIPHAQEKEGMNLSLYDRDEKLLLSYIPRTRPIPSELPEAVSPPLPPEEIPTTEELYLMGLRIKQFHNARIDPLPYFQEAIRRDPLDTRSHTQLGIHYKENGDYELAATHFRMALKRLTRNYTRPRNCEPFYHLGVVLKAQEKWEAAYDTLYRAAWDYSFSSPAYFHLAQISTHRGDFQQALVELDRCLLNNASHVNALNLKAALLRKLGESEQAEEYTKLVLERDPLNFWAYNEAALLSQGQKEEQHLISLMRDDPESYVELALQYINSGLMDEALQVLERAHEQGSERLKSYPTLSYYLGYIHHHRGNSDRASTYFTQAKSNPIDYCFPFRLETRKVYLQALAYDSGDARAHYYLGNLLYDRQAETALTHWEKAVALEKDLAMAHRNLGWGYYHAKDKLEKAITSYERAIQEDPGYPRFYEELDRLYEEKGTPIDKRYQLLHSNHETVAQHASTLFRSAQVSIAAEDFDHAIDILTSYYFNRQEGKSGLHDTYVDAMLLRGIEHLRAKNYSQALADFEAADLYPENQSMGRDETSERRAQIFYLTGMAKEKLGKKREAKTWYKKATEIEVDNPAYAYHQALALSILKQPEKADALMSEILQEGEKLLNQVDEVDFFSKFGEKQIVRLRHAEANYLLGLAALGKNETTVAQTYFEEVIRLDPGHAWARQMLIEAQ